MSLQVWMPLDNNYKNYGLNCEDASILNTVSFVSGLFGKKCFSSGAGTVSVPLDPSSTGLSISFRIKPQSPNTNSTLITFGSDRIDFNGTSYILKGSLVTDGTVLFTTANNTWTNIIIVADGTKVKVIQDGVQVASIDQNDTISNIFSTVESISVGSKTDGSSMWSGLIQDVKVYDHALSKKETIELAKSLILHYTMNHNGFGNENLISSEVTSVTYSTSANREAFEDLSVYADLSSGTYTVSAKTDGNWTAVDSTSGKDPQLNSVALEVYLTDQGGNITGSSFLDMSSGSVTFVTGSADRYYFAPIIYSDGETELTISVNNIKVEVGDKATSYCPPIGTDEFSALGLDTVESDVSDNTFDGTMSSTAPAWSSDSKVYMGSYDFSNNSYIVTPAIDLSAVDKFSVSIWAKASDLSNKILFGFDQGSRFSLATIGGYFGIYNGSSLVKFGNETVTEYNGDWHNYVITGDGTTECLYIDGNLIGTSESYVGLGTNKIYISGYGSSNDYRFSGLMNDFRLFASCLSATEVSDMFRERSAIDKRGQLYAYEFVDSDSKINISKKGIFGAPELSVFNNIIDDQVTPVDADHAFFKSTKAVSVDLFEI